MEARRARIYVELDNEIEHHCTNPARPAEFVSEPQEIADKENFDPNLRTVTMLSKFKGVSSCQQQQSMSSRSALKDITKSSAQGTNLLAASRGGDNRGNSSRVKQRVSAKAFR